MSEWKAIRLAALGDIVTGKTPSKDNPEDWGDEMPFVTPSDYSSYGKYAGNSERKLSTSGIERLRKKVVPPGSILVTCIGSDMGKSVINRVPVITNQQINSISIANEEIDPDFMYYSMVGMEDELKNLGSSGSAVPLLNKGDFEQIEVNCPGLPEQRAIASVLSSLDAKIDLLHRQNKTLEAMAEALFRQWFVEEAEEGWAQRSLSSIASYLNGVACQKYPAKDAVNRLPVLKIKELGSGITDSSDWATLTIDPKYHVVAGDVVFSWSATLMVKLWDGPKAVLNQHLFKVTSEEFPKWFYFMWTKHYVDEFVSIATSHATTFGHIKRGDLDEAMVLVPDAESLKTMTKVMEPLFDKHITNSAQIKSLTVLRDTLLPKLMSGEVRVERA